MKLIRKGIYAYESGKPKKLVSLYISYKDELGRAKKEKVDTLLPDEATLLLIERKAEIARKKANTATEKIDFRMGRATLNQVAKNFFATRTTANNLKDRQRYDKYIKPIFGDKQVAKVTVDAVETWRDTLTTTKKVNGKTVNVILTNKTKNDILSLLKMLLPTVHRVKKVEKLTIDKNKQKGRVLKDTELAQFFDALQDDSQLNLFVKLCYYTGARPQSILELTPNHFEELEEGATVHIKSMKGADSYDVPIKVDLMDIVDEWIEANHLDDNDALFFGQQSVDRGIHTKAKPVEYCVLSQKIRAVCDPIFNLTRRGKLITDKTKRVSTYTLRRTAATNIAKKVSLVAAQKFLNHQDPKTTMKYIGLDTEDVRGAINVL